MSPVVSLGTFAGYWSNGRDGSDGSCQGPAPLRAGAAARAPPPATPRARWRSTAPARPRLPPGVPGRDPASTSAPPPCGLGDAPQRRRGERPGRLPGPIWLGLACVPAALRLGLLPGALGAGAAA